jgi:hypothetical protein
MRSRETRRAAWLSGSLSAPMLASVAMLAASGCGESSRVPHMSARKSSRPNAKPAAPAAEGLKQPTKISRFIAGADGICRRLNTALARDKATQKTNNDRTVTLRNAALERATLARLRELAPPSSLGADWKQMDAYRQTLADELLRLARGPRSGETKEDRRALAATKLRVHRLLFELGHRDGFADCAEVGIAFKSSQASPSSGRGVARPTGKP